MPHRAPRIAAPWTTLAVAGALVAGLAGCTRTHSLGVRFVNVDARVRAYQVWLVEGGACDADADALAQRLLDGDEGRALSFREPPTTPLFEELEDTPSRLLVLFRDGSCRPLQVGCAAFRPSEVESVEVTARALANDLGTCAPCADGLCEGGPFDAGQPDIDDAGTDGEVGIDAGCATDAGAAVASCTTDPECGGPGRCVDRACTNVTIERAVALLRPAAGRVFEDELALVTSAHGGDDSYVNQFVGVLERPTAGGDAQAQLWALHELNEDMGVLEVDNRRSNPAIPVTCVARDMEFTDRPFAAAHALALGGPDLALFGALGTAGGDPAMVMGVPLGDGQPVQACELLPGRTVQGPAVRVGNGDAAGRYSSFVWVEVDGGTTYLARYEWEDRLGRIELPVIAREGIRGAGAPEGYHVAYELEPEGSVFVWDTRTTGPGYELTRPNAYGPPVLAGYSSSRYVLAYAFSDSDCPGRGVILRELTCAPGCDYTGTEGRVDGHYEHVQLVRLAEGGFVMVALDVARSRVVAGFFDDALSQVPVDGDWWLDVRAIPAGEEVRALRASAATACLPSPSRARIGVAVLTGPSGGGPADRVNVDVLRYAPPSCP